MAKKFTIKKFDGDTSECYAVFLSAAVKGKGNIIFWGDAKPLVTGLTRRTAVYYRDRYERGEYGNIF